MASSIIEFARSVSASSRHRTGFAATQRIEFGNALVEAAVRRFGSRSVCVEFKSYRSPWSELEDVLYGRLEFDERELCGLYLQYDGHHTWIHDAATSTSIRKKGRHLFEPIPGISALAELSCIDTLVHDFLVHDLGEDTVDGRNVRRLAIKPKQPYRSQLLSTVAFLIRRAVLDLDTETLFPVRISFVPSEDAPAAALLGSEGSILIAYSDVQILDTASPVRPFAPPAGGRVFEESHQPVEGLEDLLPFPVSLQPVPEHGFHPIREATVVSIDADNGRAYVSMEYSSEGDPSGGSDRTRRLVLTFGNYVSRNMARRRATLSEMGETRTCGAQALTVFSRAKVWERRFPGMDTQQAPTEAFFEHGGVFWFLSATAMDPESVERLACDLLTAQIRAGA
jgi:hypothetical protein